MSRILLAVATTVTLWAVPVMSQANELLPLVVTGIALDKVAVAHPAPEYPPAALRFEISGHVQVTVKVQNGNIVDASPLQTRGSSDLLPKNGSFGVGSLSPK